MTVHFKHGVAWAFAFSLAFLTIALAALTFGPQMETRLMPVVSSVSSQIVNLNAERGVLHVIAIGKKTRNCSWENVSAETQLNGKWASAAVYFSDPGLGNPKTDVPGHQVGDQFLAEMFVFPVGDNVRIQLHHRCHPLWQSTTELYELLNTQDKHS